MRLLEGNDVSSDEISSEEFNASRTLTGLLFTFLPTFLDLWRNSCADPHELRELKGIENNARKIWELS